MTKVFIVTGATGFVGNHVVKALESRGHIVVAMARDQQKAGRALSSTRSKIVYGSILNPNDIEKAFSFYKDAQYCFIHTASHVYLGKSKKTLSEMYDCNINGTKNVIEACKKHRARLLYISSVEAIPAPPKPNKIYETKDFDSKKVKGHYAKTKAEASRLILESVKSDGLDAVIVHPSAVIGPGDFSHTHMTQMMEDYRKGKIPAATNGGFDFVDVRDVADGTIAAAGKGKSGDCFILGNRYYSVVDLFNILHDLGYGKKIRLKVPMWVAKAGLPFTSLYYAIRRKRPLFTSYSLYMLSVNSNFSHERATKELGYNPRDIKETFKDVK